MHRDSDMSCKNIITWAKINQIRLWEPLEIQTEQPKKYRKYVKEFGYAGQMLPIVINYMVIHHTLTYWGMILSVINPIQYNILSHLSISGDWWYASLLTMAVTILLGKLLLCSSCCCQICGTPHWYGQLRSSQMLDSSWCIWGH